tara:strand:- start:3336 stop:3695 length:360 start_codon:yes stop_codon:yes gene_type:complete
MGLSGWWLLFAGLWPIMLPILATCRWPSFDNVGEKPSVGAGQIFSLFGGLGLITLTLLAIAYFGFDIAIYDESTGELATSDAITVLIVQLAIVSGGIFALGIFLRRRDRKRATQHKNPV